MFEVKKTDLRGELLAAEAEARAKKRKAAGLPVEDESSVVPRAAIEDEEVKKRRKVLQEALEMDKDADSDEDGDGDDDDADGPKGVGEAKYVANISSLFFFFIFPFFTPIALVLSPHRTVESMARMLMVAVMRQRQRRKRTRTRMTKRTRRPSCSGSWRR